MFTSTKKRSGWWPLALGLALAAAWFVKPRPPPASGDAVAVRPPPDGRGIEVPASPTPRSLVIGPTAAPAPAAPTAAATFEARIEAVRDHCGLPLQALCEGEACVAVVDSPDLDHVVGWLSVLGERPGLVMSTMLRDAGVDPGLVPCGHALEGVSTQPIWSVEDDRSTTGREWWCTVSTATSTEAAARLCNALVTRQRGDAFDGFSVPNPRELRFR